MTDIGDWQDGLQAFVEGLRLDKAVRQLFGAEVLGPPNPAPAPWTPGGVETIWERIATEAYERARNEPPTAILFGLGRDHESAQVAVNLLRKRFDRMAVRESAFAFDSTDGSVWGFVVESPGRPMDEAKIDQLRKEVGDAHRIGEAPE